MGLQSSNFLRVGSNLVSCLDCSKNEDEVPEVHRIQVSSNCRKVRTLAQEILHPPGTSIDSTSD